MAINKTQLQKLGLGAHGTPPKKHREAGATDKADYADPKRFKYPLMSVENVRNAIGRFGQFGQRYQPSERKQIAVRILRAAKKFKIAVAATSLVGRLAGMKKEQEK